MPSPKPLNQPVLSVVDAHHAPVVYFEEAPNFGNGNGIVHVTLATYRHLPDGTGGIKTDLVVTASLRCNIQGAIGLRKALDDALLLGAPPADGGRAN